MSKYWSKNLGILRTNNPELASRLERESVGSQVEIIPTRNNDVTARLGTVSLHSRYDPCREAHRMVEEFVIKNQAEIDGAKTGKPLKIVVFGFSMGYHVEELVQVVKREGWQPESGRIIVVEPRYPVLRAAMESRDLSGVLPHVTVIAGPNPDITQELTDAGGGNELIPHIRYVHAPSRTLDPDVLAKIEMPQVGTARVSAQARRLKILAVSPIYGGSVPTFQHSTDALRDLGHRVEILDNTPYFDMLMGIENLTRSEDHRQSLRALLSTFLAECSVAKAMEMRADMVFAVAQSPMVPDALRELKQLKIPTAFWFVEDRFLFPYWKEYASLYDYFFVIQRGEFLEELQRMGVKNAHYLPCAAHPPIHRPVKVTPHEQEKYGSDLSFMGAGYYNRQQMYMKLLDFDFKIWGQDWNLASPLGRMIQQQGERIAPEEYIKVYNASKINLNLHSSPTHEGVNPHGDFVNPRTFELAACRAFQLVDHRSEMPELFEVGKEMITFKDPYDLREKIKYYLDHPEERDTIAGRAQERVLAEHTYTHRMEAMLEQIAAQEPALQSTAVAANSPAALSQQAGTDTELGQYLAKFDDDDELTVDRISEEIRKGTGELTHTEGIFLLMKEFQDWAREKGVINT